MICRVSEPKTYEGSCHCGQVRFRVEMDLSRPVTVCNCSICQRTGTMLSFVPADKFTLESGEDALTDYQFGRKHLHHLFCSRCGVKSFARGTGRDGTPMVAVNVRCLESVELDALAVNRFNGRAL
jgi:hypothetical protein